MNSHDEIRSLMKKFQDSYTNRDLTKVESFMELFFKEETEVADTNGLKPGVDEWYMGRASARKLVEGDWEGWGDLRLDLDTISIHSRGDLGWVAASATVTKFIDMENYDSYLQFLKTFIDIQNSEKSRLG